MARTVDPEFETGDVVEVIETGDIGTVADVITDHWGYSVEIHVPGHCPLYYRPDELQHAKPEE